MVPSELSWYASYRGVALFALHILYPCTLPDRCVFWHLLQAGPAYDSGFTSLQGSPIMATSPTAASQAALGLGNATPSNTLFVTNLGPFCSEQEVTDLFASFTGFSRLRMTKQPVTMQNGLQSFCAFVEYTVSVSQSIRLCLEC